MAKRPAGKTARTPASGIPLRPDFQIRDRDREDKANGHDEAADVSPMRRAAAGDLPTANMNGDAGMSQSSVPDIASATHGDIVTLLAQISARLHQNERERLSIRQSLGDYKNLLDNLEDKTEQSEKIFLTLQDKLSKQESAEDSLRRRQQDLEDKQNDYAGRIDKAADLADRIDSAMADQARLNRRLDKITQDKQRFIRKLERIEETVVETQSALQQKAMVVLTDHNNALAANAASPGFYTSSPPVQRFGLIGTLVACGIVAGLAFALGQAWTGTQHPVPEIYGPQRPALSAAAKPSVVSQTPAQLNARFDADPDALAKDLNALNPGSRPPSPPAAATTTAVEAGFDPQAFLKAQAATGAPSLRIKADTVLPPLLKTLESRAFKGSASAQNALASVYAAGNSGAKADLGRAALWFREAATRNVADAQYNLGVLYAGGNGVKQDARQALDWYRLAALQGQTGALYNLGVAHIEGRTASYDPLLAARYFQTAAQDGLNDAAYNLAVIYEQGLLAKPDKLAAIYWYKHAADGGNVAAADAVKRLTRDLRLTPAVIADATATAPVLPFAASAATPATARAMTARVQEQLIRLGLYPGPADGTDNQATHDAILTYQRLSRLPADGQASQDLLTDMLQGTAREDAADGEDNGTLHPADMSKPGGA